MIQRQLHVMFFPVVVWVLISFCDGCNFFICPIVFRMSGKVGILPDALFQIFHNSQIPIHVSSQRFHLGGNGSFIRQAMLLQVNYSLRHLLQIEDLCPTFIACALALGQFFLNVDQSGNHRRLPLGNTVLPHGTGILRRGLYGELLFLVLSQHRQDP